MGSQKNRLDETVLLSTKKDMFKPMGKKKIAILRTLILLIPLFHTLPESNELPNVILANIWIRD